MIVNFIISPFRSLFLDKTINFDILFFSLILIVLPVLLITGPALPDIFLSLISLYFLVKSILKKQWKYYQNPITYGFLLFSFYGIIRSCFSEMPFESLTNGGSIFYFRYIFFSLGVWYLLDANRHLSKCLINISIICILFICIDSLYQYFFNFNLFGNPKHDNSRLTSLFGDEPIVGRYISYLSIFIFTLIYQNFSDQKNIMKISIIFLVICEVVVFLSGERAPLFNMILFSILIILFIPKYRFYKIINIFFSIIIILTITLFNPNAKTRIIDLTFQQINQTKLSFLPYSDHHEEHYISALKMFSDKPFFGVGTNLFRFQCDKPEYKYKSRSCNTHPHNYYFQILAELGFLGFSFLMVLFLYFSSFLFKQLFKYFKLNKDKSVKYDFLLYPIMLFIYWWPMIPHMSFYNNWNNVLMMLPLGFFMRYLYGKSNNGNFIKV